MLDSFGRRIDADIIDYLLLKMAMSLEDARMLLSVPAAATEDDIQKAWRQKALENHPDRGGDVEKMKAINVARDILLGQSVPERPVHREPQPTYRAPERPKVEKIVSMEDAMKEASVPEDVLWTFITEPGYGQNLAGSQRGQVIYGTTNDAHVFVGMYHYQYNNHFENTKIDTWKFYVRQMPLEAKLSIIGPEIIRELWSKFEGVKQYNAKVRLIPPGQPLRNAVWDHRSEGRSVSFKDAMSLMGEDTPESWEGRKVKIIMEMGSEDYKNLDKPRPITLVVNGKPYALSDDSCARAKRVGLAKFVFGTYVYSDSKKDLTRIPKDKAVKVFNFLLKLKDSEPKELMDAIEKALQQVTK